MSRSADIAAAAGLSASAIDLPDRFGARDQPAAWRALEVAAAGGHSLLVIGPAGSGKSGLARCLPGLLPPRLESRAGGVGQKRAPARPVRYLPATARIGEVIVESKLARCGVLVVDDLHAIGRHALVTLAEVLDAPDFQAVATMQPCPCGERRVGCLCTPQAIRRHRRRVERTVLDRFEIVLELEPPAPWDREPLAPAESTAAVAGRVARAWQVQRRRPGGVLNTDQRPAAVARSRDFSLDPPCRQLLAAASERLRLTSRAALSILRVARTVADLAGSDTLRPGHLAEAIQVRYEAIRGFSAAGPRPEISR